MHLKIPPPIVLIIAMLLMYGFGVFFPSSKVAFQGQLVLGLALVGVATALILYALVCLRRAKTTFNPIQPGKASTLVTSGPFRFSRNPIYLADAIYLVATAVLLGSPSIIIILPGFFWYLTAFQIKPEETHLEHIFGEPYTNYLKNVRRWI